jgi:hypothetical protein
MHARQPARPARSRQRRCPLHRAGLPKHSDRRAPLALPGSVLLKADGRLYWIIPAVLANLADGVISAWLFLLKVPG